LAFEAQFVFFCHAPSVTLDARLVGEAWPPRFLTKLVMSRQIAESSLIFRKRPSQQYQSTHLRFLEPEAQVVSTPPSAICQCLPISAIPRSLPYSTPDY